MIFGVFIFLLLESDFLPSLLDRQDSLHLFPVHSGPKELRVSTAEEYYFQHQVVFNLVSNGSYHEERILYRDA